MRPSEPLANALPHNAGEVWASALMDCYVSLLRAHPFAEARDRIMRYLVSGLRAMPFEPTFTEAAAAVRAVAWAADPADGIRFATEFARRGLGLGAVSPPRTSTDLVGLVESYATDASTLRIHSITLDDSLAPCDADGVLDVGETGALRVTVENVGYVSTSWSLDADVTVHEGSLFFPSGPWLHFRSLAPGERVTAWAPVQLSAPSTSADVEVSFGSGMSVLGAPVRFNVPLNYDERFASTTDTMSTRKSSLSVERDGVRQPFAPTRDANDEFAHIDDGPARGTAALVTGPLQVTSTLGVSFRRRHSFLTNDLASPLDGAVVEISEDEIHFEDLMKGGANAGYTGALADGANSPIGARPAYTGMSEGFPAFVTRSIDLGNAYVGKSVVLRFRVGSSGSGKSAYGLDIDDLTVTGVAGTPFAARVGEPANPSCDRASHRGRR